MKTFNNIFIAIIIFLIASFLVANILVFNVNNDNSGRPYRVEINRLANYIENNGVESIDLAKCDYVISVVSQENNKEDFYITDNDYIIVEINGVLYRFDYKFHIQVNTDILLAVNIILIIISIFVICVMSFIKRKILQPFDELKDVPYELSKGNLTLPIKEEKNRFFGRFVWGVDLLRENIEQQKKRETELKKDKKTMLLSLSHDVKTPLSAIKLYSKALSKNLYNDKEKQIEIAENINAKTEEIENLISQIITASKDDFSEIEVNMGEYYLSALINKVCTYYKEKMALAHIDFQVGSFSDCIIKGDINRSVEVIQNLIENAIKYGDGAVISMEFTDEDNCKLISVKNTGCDLPEKEILYIFDCFYRGTNAKNKGGSGLGLHICKSLMHKMNGDIFAEIYDRVMAVTLVFNKA